MWLKFSGARVAQALVFGSEGTYFLSLCLISEGGQTTSAGLGSLEKFRPESLRDHRMLRLDLSKRIALVACDYGRPAQCFPLATQATKLLTFGHMMGYLL